MDESEVVVVVVVVLRRGFGVVRVESGRESEKRRLVFEGGSVREGGVWGGSWEWRVHPRW